MKMSKNSMYKSERIKTCENFEEKKIIQLYATRLNLFGVGHNNKNWAILLNLSFP